MPRSKAAGAGDLLASELWSFVIRRHARRDHHMQGVQGHACEVLDNCCLPAQFASCGNGNGDHGRIRLGEATQSFAACRDRLRLTNYDRGS